MPKETFLKLSKEKQQKVINAAKKEFARAPIENVSIKNIVEEADIARGSFYQYFESKYKTERQSKRDKWRYIQIVYILIWFNDRRIHE